jgi:cytochrome oxidase Cu insertion factor (SCO1/SenC/PrrC family)
MRWPLLVTAIVVLVAVTAAWVASERSRTHHDGYSALPAVQADALAPFSLQRGDGQAFTNADLGGRVHLIYFGFTTCPDVCPTELGWMTRVLRQLGPLAGQVQPVFVTIDPERDTPAKLADYAAVFNPRLLALHGTPEQTTTAAGAFGVVFRKQTPVSQQPGFYLFDHTMTTFVIDRSGRLVHRLASHEVSPEAAAALIRPLAGAAP